MNKIYSILVYIGLLTIAPHLVLAADPLNMTGVTTSGPNGTGNIVFIPNATQKSPSISAFAVNDDFSVDTSKTITVTGNVINNDSITTTTYDGNNAKIQTTTKPNSVGLLWNTPAASPYGYLNFQSDGAITYTLYDKALEILRLQPGKTLEDVFEYTIQDRYSIDGKYFNVQDDPGAKATIRIHIAGNPGQIVVRNDEVSVDTQVKLKVEGDLTTNDDYGTNGVNSVAIALQTAPSSQYGFLSLDSSGKFTYTLYDKAPIVQALKAGETRDDIFTYQVTYQNGSASKTGILTVHITGNPPFVKVRPDEATVSTSDIIQKYCVTTGGTQVDSCVNDNAAIVVSGDVTVNDADFEPNTVTLKGSVTGKYGFLNIQSSGKFEYRIYQTLSSSQYQELNALKNSGKEYTEVFTYNILGKNGVGNGDASISIHVVGDSTGATQPKAIDDVATVLIDNVTASSSTTVFSVTMNVLENDINLPDKSTASLSGSPVGKYGFIDGSLKADGTMIYRVNINNPEVKALLTGNTNQALKDSFSYTVNGNSSLTGKIDVYIVTGSITGLIQLKAYDFVDTIVAEEIVTSTGSTSGSNSSSTTTTTNVNPKGNLVIYNNTLLGIDKFATRSEILSTLLGKYGYLKFSSGTNEFEYVLNFNVPEIQALRNTDTPLEDVFKYRIYDINGKFADASIIIKIVSRREQVTNDNVEIENNNKSNLATPLNSGAYMRGNLMNSSDRDYYFISSNGNEIIHLELCPQGFNCYNQKAWVLYALDGEKLTSEVENKTVTIPTWIRDDTGEALASATFDHMYLLYDFGYLDPALIGVIDPCFGSRNSVDISVPTLEPGKTRNYFIAISSPLQRSDGTTTTTTTTDNSKPCGGGNVVQKKKGPSIDVPVAAPSTTTTVTGSTSVITTATTKSVTTTEQFIAVLPSSDDQYTLKVTRTGTSPINTRSSTDEVVFSASTGTVTIPKIRVENNQFEATLALAPGLIPKAKGVPEFRFSLVDFKVLTETLSANAYRGNWNPNNNQVEFPRVRVVENGEVYHVVLQFMGNRLFQLSSIEKLSQ